MELQGLDPVKRVAYFEYDFAKDGGAVGDIALRGGSIPAGAIVRNGVVHVITAVTSTGAATVALKLKNANDILAATAKASLTLGAVLDVVPVDTAATSILNATAGAKVVATIGTEVLLTGKIVVALEYF